MSNIRSGAGSRRRVALGASGVATADRAGISGGDPLDAVLARLRRPVVERVHADHAGARQQRRAAQRHLWQPRDDAARRADRRRRSASWRRPTCPSTAAPRALSTVIRFINDVLLSAPSIVIGLFVYTLVVVPMGHFSAHRRRDRARHHRHSGHGAHRRGHAAADSAEHAAWLGGARGAALAHDHQHRLSGGAQRPADRACCWRSRASAARPRRCCSRR